MTTSYDRLGYAQPFDDEALAYVRSEVDKGKQAQFSQPDGGYWHTIAEPTFCCSFRWRVKPIEEPGVTMQVEVNGCLWEVTPEDDGYRFQAIRIMDNEKALAVITDLAEHVSWQAAILDLAKSVARRDADLLKDALDDECEGGAYSADPVRDRAKLANLVEGYKLGVV